MNIDLDGVSLDLSFLPEDVQEKAKEAVEGAYSTAVAGLKSKQQQLLGNIKDLKDQVKNAGEGATADVLRQLTDTQEKLSSVENELQIATHNLSQNEQKLASAKESADTWQGKHDNLVKTQGLTQELVKLGVSTHLMDGAIAVHLQNVSLGEDSAILMGDKPIGEALKEWSEGEVGKAYISAGANAGGDAGGGDGKGGGDKPYSEMSLSERAAFAAKNPEEANRLEQESFQMPTPKFAQNA